jgi:hypothetical protein
MPTPSRKPALNSLNGAFTLTKEIREAAGVDENIITIEAKKWTKPAELVQDYFLNNTTHFVEDGADVHTLYVNALTKLGARSKPVIPVKLNVFCTKVATYLGRSDKKSEFLSYFEVLLGEAKKNKQAMLTNTASDTTGMVLARKSLLNIEKRALEAS